MRFTVVFGGASYEHEISIVSAIALKNRLKSELGFVFLSPDQRFYLISSSDMKADYFASGKYRKSKELFLQKGGFASRSLFGSTPIEKSTIINLVHGAEGEDGKLASLFEFFDVPFISPRLEASVLSFNKLFTKYLADIAGVKSLEFEMIRRNETPTTNYPFIIKPLRLGSSIGISVIKDASELEYALDVAFEFDSEVLIEPFVAGVKEYNLAGCKAGDQWHFSIIEEPAKADMLDFDQKYLDFGRSEQAKQADLSADQIAQFQEAFKKIYSSGFDGALIRCDFFYIDGEVYINEINPIPGSLANYLFDDFEAVLKELAINLPKSKKISVSYDYIHKIRSAKGKL